MEIFSEIHNRYFYIIREILKVAATRKLSVQEIAAAVAQDGFAETPLALLSALKNEADKGYCLLQETAGGYAAGLKNPPPLTLTALQRRWLKTLLQDRRCSLFFAADEQQLYNELLADSEPLYDNRSLIMVDRAGDGDDYEDARYQLIFTTIMQAVQTKKLLRITYESGKHKRLSAYFAPYKLEYSLKDDKFRLCAVHMRKQTLKNLYKLNLSRIQEVTVMDWNVPAATAEFIKSKRLPLPVEIEISNERNGFERIFTQLSNFERISEYDETAKTCWMKIFYYEVDVMELLITLLSFGPIIRVLGPESFKAQFVERILKQKQLLEKS